MKPLNPRKGGTVNMLATRKSRKAIKKRLRAIKNDKKLLAYYEMR